MAGFGPFLSHVSADHKQRDVFIIFFCICQLCLDDPVSYHYNSVTSWTETCVVYGSCRC